jgi:hypothetical protein
MSRYPQSLLIALFPILFVGPFLFVSFLGSRALVLEQLKGRRWAWHCSRTVAIDVFLSFNFAVTFFNVNQFPPFRDKLLGD